MSEADFAQLKAKLDVVRTSAEGRQIMTQALPTLKAMSAFARYLAINDRGPKEALFERLVYHTFGYRIFHEVLRRM